MPRLPPSSTLFPYTTLFRSWSSMLHDSIAPTMLEAGIRANVVPSEARANLNIRLLPGDLIDPLVAELKKRSEEHTSELQSRQYLVCRLLLEKKKKTL